MLSLSCKAAIKAVIYLASKYESGDKAGIKEISAYTDSNEHTIGKLLQTLVKENIIMSMKGPSGGFYLSRAQLNQPVIHTIEAIDGKRVFKECGLGLSKCSATHPCPIHNEYKKAREFVERLFRQKKIADLCHPVNDGFAHLMG